MFKETTKSGSRCAAALCRLLLLALLACLMACDGGGTNPVLASVDGQDITLQEFKARASFLGLGDDPTTMAPQLRRALLTSLARRALLLQEAKELGVSLRADETARQESLLRAGLGEESFAATLGAYGIGYEDWKEELRRTLLERKTVRLALGAKAKATPREVAEYYQANLEEYARPEQVLALHVVLPSEALARQLLAKVRGGEDLAEAAAAMGYPLVSGEAPQWLGRGHMPEELDAVVFSMPKGKLAGPIKSEYGYHVILVSDHRDALEISLEEAALDIEKKLITRKTEELAEQWTQRLAAGKKIWLDPLFIREGKVHSNGD